MSSFNATVFVTEQMNKLIANSAQELCIRAIKSCGEHYKFDSEDAIRMLGINQVSAERKKTVEKVKAADKRTFPLPYNGEKSPANCCQALRQNNGLYTQCHKPPMETSQFCKSCQVLADKTDGVPEYGTIGDRAAVGIFEYVDPKGRKPVSYTKIMKKHNLTREQVLSEAEKYHITIDPEHFVIPINSKRGRPSTKTSESKEPKGAKGRPKKK